MPIADSAETARRWAHDRAITLWAIYCGDLGLDALNALVSAKGDLRADGARFALVVTPNASAGALERILADIVVEGPEAPSPFGLFSAMQEAALSDVRTLGVIGGHRQSLEAGHRAGAGAVVGLAAGTPGDRLPLLDAQPDFIVTVDEFAQLDQRRYGSTRSIRQRVLLNPGPSVVSDRVHRAVGGPDLCHREAEYPEMLDNVKRKLLRIAGVGDDWSMVMLAGSGTAAMEAMTGAAAREGRKILVCKNGIYGERIETIARRLGSGVVLVTAEDLRPIDPRAVAIALDADPLVDAVAVIHHETTTGLLNPVHEIAAEADKRGVLTVVDAISSFGSEELRLDGTGIDFVASTSNKCLHGLPGAAFVLVSPRGKQRIHAVAPRSLYFDLPAYLQAQEKRTVPFTPAIPAIYGLDAALDELLDEGLAHRQAYYQERMAYLDREFARLALEPRVPAAYRSRCVRSLPLPAGISYDELHDAVKKDGYVIYGGLGEAALTSFRVCALGALKVEALEGFIVSLENAINRRHAGALA